MDFNAFSHGQIQAKQWLCESLEPHLPNSALVVILGCWYNVLGLLMLTRNKEKYQEILGIDIDPNAIEIADKICMGWRIREFPIIRHRIEDASISDIHPYNVVINTSVEHMTLDWFDRVVPGTIVCIQSTDLELTDEVWKITNPTKTLSELSKKFNLSTVMFSDTQVIDYDSWGYNRFMIIGKK